jgi:hypothetical protein
MYAFSSASVVTKMAYSSSSSASARRSTALSAAGTSRVSSNAPAAALAAPPSKKLPSGEGSTEAAALIRTVCVVWASGDAQINTSFRGNFVGAQRTVETETERGSQTLRTSDLERGGLRRTRNCVVQNVQELEEPNAALFGVFNFSQRLPAV